MDNLQEISNEVNNFFVSTAKTFQSAPMLRNKLLHKATWARAGQVQPVVQETEGEQKYKDDRPPEQNEAVSMSSSSSESIELVQPRLWHSLSRHRMAAKKKHPVSSITLSAIARSHKDPDSSRITQTYHHDGIRKAMTWFGQPFHKKEASVTLDQEQNMYDANVNHLQPSRSIAQGTTKMLHCKKYEYHLEVQLDGVMIHSHMGFIKRVGRNTSTARPEQTFVFPVDGPFELKLLLRGQPLIPARVKDGIKWLKDLCSGPGDHHPMPVIGSKQLLSGESVDQFAATQGTSRYTLTPPLAKGQRSFDVEVMIMFRLDNQPAHPSALHKFIAAAACHRSQDFQNCRQGGYLTFYVRGEAHPIWIRYWVKLRENAYLDLYNATYKGSLVDTITIANIRTVMEPSEDDQERVYMASSRGVVLQFHRTSIAKAGDDLDGKMFFYADTVEQAFYWRQELSAYATTKGNLAIEKDRVNLRYIW
ncbi:hypothetical protein BX666DRAFT_2030594 [Dichotomocladium elegans]|nr:hypothetical protein BX666DRAFT_2030594 [Dichotomocladium elegans]